MITVLSFYGGDRHLAVKLSEWIAELGGVQNHRALIVYDAGTTTDGVLEPLKSAFKEVMTYKVVGAPQADWSAGTGDASACNEMWIQTAQFIARMKDAEHWLWMEADCIPLKPSWADDIEAEARKHRKAFTGARVVDSRGMERMSGIAVYPPNVAHFSVKALTTDIIPWDIEGAEDFKKNVHYTRLIHHILRTSKDAPNFPTQNEVGTINKDAVLFHPCKDSSLIDRLRERKQGFIPPPQEQSTTEKLIQKLESNSESMLVRTQNIEVESSQCKKDFSNTLEDHSNPSTDLTLADNFKIICAKANDLIQDKPGRKAQFVTALREAHLIGPAKKRK